MTAKSTSYRALVIDDEVLVRVATARALTRAGFHCQMAADGKEAWQALDSDRFDIVVTDIRMPHLNGHALAVDLLSRKERPLIIVLTGVLEPRIVRDLMVRGVDDVCFKPIDYGTFIAKIQALLHRRAATQHVHPPGGETADKPDAGSEVSTPAGPADADEPAAATALRKPVEQADPLAVAKRLVQQSKSVPPAPQLLVTLLRFMDVEEIPLKELSDVVAADAGATAALLRLASNSPLGTRRKISRAFDAINLLGARRAVSLVVSDAIVSVQTELTRKWPRPHREWYHKRSMIIAGTAATFAAKLENVPPETAFVLGLLQELGILVLGNGFAPRYFDTTLRRVRENPSLELHTAESGEYGFGHAEVSAALLQQWNLPPFLIELILDHHDLGAAAKHSPRDQRLLRVMQIGEALADFFELPHPLRRDHLQGRLSTDRMEWDGQPRELITTSVSKAVESCRIFSLPPPHRTELEQLSAQLDLAGSLGS